MSGSGKDASPRETETHWIEYNVTHPHIINNHKARQIHAQSFYSSAQQKKGSNMYKGNNTFEKEYRLFIIKKNSELTNFKRLYDLTLIRTVNQSE